MHAISAEHRKLGGGVAATQQHMSAMVTRFDEVGGLRVRVAEGGVQDATTVLMTSPWPESIVAFRNVWPALADRYHIVALDLPGFGQSASRSGVLNPRAMGDLLLGAIGAFGLKTPHVVAQDVGTSAALFAALTEPDAFASLTIGSGIMHEELATGSLKELMEAPALDQLAGLDGAQLITDALNRLLPTLDQESLADYQTSYKGDRFAVSAEYVRSYREWLPQLRSALPRVRTPVNVLYGRRDPLVPRVHAEILVRGLPNVRHTPLDSGHLAWEEVSGIYAAELLDWITTGYRGFSRF
jgi:pimeloyl-ACP methyl ester carboxylesterase